LQRQVVSIKSENIDGNAEDGPEAAVFRRRLSSSIATLFSSVSFPSSSKVVDAGVAVLLTGSFVVFLVERLFLAGGWACFDEGAGAEGDATGAEEVAGLDSGAAPRRGPKSKVREGAGGLRKGGPPANEDERSKEWGKAPADESRKRA
jgi:hypothetical protein